MRFNSITVKDKNDKDIELRSAEVQDAEALIEYLKVTNAESPYLICEPEEITLTPEQEKNIITGKEESERELLLLAFEIHSAFCKGCCINTLWFISPSAA